MCLLMVHMTLLLLDMLKDGTLTWDEAMQSASSDAARLALLDGASTISRTLRSFVDDTRVAIASWDILVSGCCCRRPA